MKWNKLHSSNSLTRIKSLQASLDRAKLSSSLDVTTVHGIEQELVYELRNKEKFWEQKARLQWLKARDRNTSFFHAQVLQKREK